MTTNGEIVIRWRLGDGDYLGRGRPGVWLPQWVACQHRARRFRSVRQAKKFLRERGYDVWLAGTPPHPIRFVRLKRRNGSDGHTGLRG